MKSAINKIIKSKVKPNIRYQQYDAEVSFIRNRERTGGAVLKNNPSSKALYRLTEAMMKAGLVHGSCSNYSVIWKAVLRKGSKDYKSMVIVRRPKE